MATASKLKPMPSVWRSLLWKEWHQHKWPLLGLTGMVLLFSIFFRGTHPDSLLVTISMAVLCYGLLTGLFVGMGTAAGENQRGTMQFLRALPISMAKPAAVRLAVSSLTVIIPILVVVAIGYAYLAAQNYHPLDVENMLEWTRNMSTFTSDGTTTIAGYSAMLALYGSLMTGSLLVWMATFGVNRSDEIRAGAAGFLVIAGVWIALMSCVSLAERYGWSFLEDSLTVAMAGSPGGAGMIETFSSVGFNQRWIYVATTILVHGLLVWQFLTRYGRSTHRLTKNADESARALQTSWLLPPRKSQVTAIAWKQFRETGPLVLVAPVVVLLLALLIHWINRNEGYSSHYSEALAGTALGVGFLVTVVTGMGVFLEDMKPQVGAFWRSRPVNITTWFLVKFFTGLTVLVVSFGLLFVLAYLLPGGQQIFVHEHAAVQLSVMGMLMVLTYTVSMASYCLGRHPIVALCGSLGGFFCGLYGFQLVVDSTTFKWEAELGIALLVVAQMVAMALAWLALRNNWGWHRN